jgi:hypothetical protein
MRAGQYVGRYPADGKSAFGFILCGQLVVGREADSKKLHHDVQRITQEVCRGELL